MAPMNPSLYDSTADGSGLAGHLQLNFFLVYEDYVTGTDTMRSLNRFIQRTGLPHEFSTQNVWKFETLATLPLRNIAASEAARADMVIIAAHGPGLLPVAVMHWIELWIAQRGTSPAALVALLDGADGDTCEALPLETYLEKCARRGRMDFFVQRVGERLAVDDYDFAMIAEKAEATSEALAQIMQRPRGLRPRMSADEVTFPGSVPNASPARLELAQRAVYRH
jgi:hypothetical protein